MASFATLDDLQKMWRNLQPTERERAEALLDTVSDMLREEAYQYGKDLDNMILERESFRNVVKSVTVDVVSRALMTSTNQEPMTQFAQSAMGYSVSGSYLIPGGGIYIKESEKKRLKLTTQRFGVIEPYGN
jgi:hypothetical protein|nr:MAG TPA: hypothetical protein [Caudoviricetes sp.]